MAAKNEAKVRFSADTKGFNDEIKSANRELAGLRTELKLNEAQMKANGVSIEGLQEKQKILTAQMEAAQDKTKALSDKLAVAVEIFGENSEEAAKLKNQLLQAQTAEVNLQRALSDCNAELERQEQAANSVESASEKLSGEIEDQQKELDKLKRAYADYVVKGEASSREAKELASQIDRLSGDLKDNKYAMERAEKAADELDNSMEDAGESAEEAGDGFTVFKGVVADLVSNGIQSAISGLGELAGSFLSLADDTRETRTQLALLYSSFDEADYATDALYALGGVLGDTGRAVEASTLLAKMSQNASDLEANTRILTGVFAEYGEAIPTEGLAEGMAATAAMGTVQGVLADALEWQGINLDEFNEKLGKMSSEEERASLIQQTLTDLYGESADAYRETNASLIEANEAQMRYDDGLASLGEKSEPITTGIKNGFSQIFMVISDLADSADFGAIGGAIEGAFTWFAREGIPAIVQGVQDFIGWLKKANSWVKEHSGLLIALGAGIGVVVTAIGAYNVVQGIKAAMDAAQVTTIWGLVAAHWAQATAAMAALAPYILIVAAIAAVIAIIVLCIMYWDEIVAAVMGAVEAVKNVLGAVGAWINDNVIQPIIGFFVGLWDGIVSAFHTVIDPWVEIIKRAAAWVNETIIQPIAGFFVGLWNSITEIFSVVGNWFNEKVVQPIVGFFSGMWNSVKNGAKAAWDGIVSIFSSVASFFGNIFGKAWEGVKNVFSVGGKIFDGIKDGIITAFKAVVNTIIRGINTIVALPFNGLNGILDTLQNLSFLGISPFGWITWRAPVPQIPYLAEGGILTQATLNVAGEAGPEAVIPIDKLQTYISSAIDKSMQNDNIQALAAAVEDLANRPIEMFINGREFALATATDTDVVNGNRMVLTKRGLAL